MKPWRLFVLILAVLFFLVTIGISCSGDDEKDAAKPEPEPCVHADDVSTHIETSISIDATNAPEIRAYLSTVNQNGDALELCDSDVRIYEAIDYHWEWKEKDFQLRVVDVPGDPIHVALALDYSGSMEDFTDEVEQAASEFVDIMAEGDRAEIIKFSTGIRVEQGFTSSKADLLAAIFADWDGLGEKTSLYDAIDLAIDDALEEPTPHVVMVLSDGGDTRKPPQRGYEVIAKGLDVGVPVFTFGFGAARTFVLSEIADGTGGVFYETGTTADLEDAYNHVSNAIDKVAELKWKTDAGGNRVMLNVETTYRTAQGVFTSLIETNYPYGGEGSGASESEEAENPGWPGWW